MDNPVAFGQAHKSEIATLVDTADLALAAAGRGRSHGSSRHLASENPMVRYWAAMVCTAFGKQAQTLAEDVEAAPERRGGDSCGSAPPSFSV